MIGFRTVKQGQRVAVWNDSGQMRLVDGPKRMFLFCETANAVRRVSAEADEYLVIRYSDGRAEHVRGPADVWMDPVEHEAIHVEKALTIDAHEAIVVYSRDNGDVHRRIVRGPALFVPTEKEWLHQFHWHGAAGGKGHGAKAARALNFTKLWVIPDQMYFDVVDVRTSDDALIMVKLMVFFELLDIEQMLDQTHDPIADFINALAADTIDFVGGLTFEQFKQQTEKLNDLTTYENLTRRAERIGYRINKVVYRGYVASQALQLMHDNAIEARTQLKLEAETEQQAQDLADLKLERAGQRAETQREMARQQADHERQLKQLSHEQQLREQQAEHELDATAQRMLNEVELDQVRAKNAEQAGFLQSVKSMDVDVTRYLVAQYQNPDRLIRIDGSNGSQLHLHDE